MHERVRRYRSKPESAYGRTSVQPTRPDRARSCTRLCCFAHELLKRATGRGANRWHAASLRYRDVRAATRREWSPGARRLSLTLRSGVKFHTGRPFASEDAKFNLEHLREPAVGSQW